MAEGSARSSRAREPKRFEEKVFVEFESLQAANLRIETQLSRLVSACDRLLPKPGAAAAGAGEDWRSIAASVPLGEIRRVAAPVAQPGGDSPPKAQSMLRASHDLLALSTDTSAALMKPSMSVPLGRAAMTPKCSDKPSASELAQRILPDMGPELSRNWPACIKVRPEFAKKAALHHFTRSDGLMVFSVLKTESECSGEGGMEKSLNVEGQRRPWYERLAIDPNSKVHMLYNALSLVVLFYDLTVLPFTLAWDVSITGWQMWGSSCFWTFDLFMNFFIGFYRADRLVMDLRAIAKTYLRTWFPLDVSLVLIDYAAIAMDVNRSVKFFRFAKVGRVLRLVGMVRMLRVVRIVEALAETRLSQGSRLLFTVSRYFVAILWFSHLLSCCWFGIGRPAFSDTGGNWFASSPVRGPGWILPYEDTSMVHQYVVALHWAVGQIALGPVDSIPQNTLERIFCVLATMIGFLFGSTLVSSLSAAMIDYQMSRKDKVTKMRSLRRYLLQNQVIPRLSTLVTRQAENRLSCPAHLREADVPALSLLSATLRAELKMEILRPHLESHPMFSLWLSVDEVAMQRVCFEAVHWQHLRSAEELFAAGAEATAAHFLVGGELSYEQEPFSSFADGMLRTDVHEGSWICEAALWTKWVHVGKALAIVECDLLRVSAKELAKSTGQSLALEQLAVEYAKQYHKRVVNAKPPHAPYPTDLEVSSTDFHDVVVTMGREVQVLIGVHALNHCTHGPRDYHKRMQLKEEVTNSKCLVVVTRCGALLRVVSLVVLNLRRANGMIFAQVGKLDGSTLKPACELPGLKQDRNEVVSEALRRLLDTKLSFISDRVELLSCGSETTQKESKEFSVQTRYCRNMCTAKLKQEADAELALPVCDVVDPSVRTDDRVPLALYNRPVFVSSDAARCHLYAWLTPEEFAYLSSPAGDAGLDAWVRTLALPHTPSVEIAEEPTGSDDAASDTSKACDNMESQMEEISLPSDMHPDNHSQASTPRGCRSV